MGVFQPDGMQPPTHNHERPRYLESISELRSPNNDKPISQPSHAPALQGHSQATHLFPPSPSESLLFPTPHQTDAVDIADRNDDESQDLELSHNLAELQLWHRHRRSHRALLVVAGSLPLEVSRLSSCASRARTRQLPRQ